jgi:diguanylate cyclase (GGDEF)-like protein
MLCGMTHLLEIWALWHPICWLSRSLQAITAVISCYTAFLLRRSLPNLAQMEEINQLLLQRVIEGKQAEQKIRQLNTELEVRVKQRTWELQQSTEHLKTEIFKHQRAEEELRLWQSLTQGLIFQRQQLESERDRLASFPELNPNPIVEVDLACQVRYLNPKALQLFPNLLRWGLDHPFLEQVPSVAAALQHQQKVGNRDLGMPERVWSQIPQHQTLLESQPSATTFDLVARNQPSIEPVAVFGTPDFHQSMRREVKIGDVYYEQVMHYVAPDAIRIYGFDITDRKRAEAQLIHNALYDSLTQLPSRALFLDRLGQATKRAKQEQGYLFAVLFLDVDRFKIVNDSLGHLMGNQLLFSVARILKNCLRSTDTVSRLGGDEFAILLEAIHDISDATLVADRIHKALSSPLFLDQSEVFVTVSIGIALSTIDLEQPEDILRDADTAMYRAKAQGKACYEVFDLAMHTHAVASLQLETDLRRAIARQEFLVYYQPIVCLLTRNIVGFEALLRWQHPERGLVPPDEFIPLAEETGLIVPIGWWTLREACRQLRDWQQQFPTTQPLTINVNLSGKQFSQPDCLQQVEDVLASTQMAVGSLKLEITESAIAQKPDMSTALLRQLQKRNIQLCIDDFGTGYSSLSRLQNFPINTLKIDRSFVKRLGTLGENLEIVRAIVTLAHNLGMDVVAEGVEVPDQVTALMALQCQYGQGYFFSQPVNSETAQAMLVDEWNRQGRRKRQQGKSLI